MLVRIVILAIAALVSFALTTSPTAAQARKRHALLIGASDYHALPSLPAGPRNVVRLGQALERLGFDVVKVEYPDLKSIRSSVAAFQRNAIDAEAAVFYFTGYGLSLRDAAYLLPI